MAEHICADLLNALQATRTLTTYKVKYTQKTSQNYADSAKKNRKHLITYSMNAPAFNKHALTFYTTNPSQTHLTGTQQT